MKLELAAKGLLHAVQEAGGAWNDASYERFRETYIEPLGPKVRELLDAINRMDQVLHSADRACGPS
jgi:hypothetical protein